jgi:polyphosphate kinase 2
MGLLTESHRIKELMSSRRDTINEGLFKNLINSIFGGSDEDDLDRREEVDEIIDLLRSNKVDNDEITSLVNQIQEHPNAEDVNFFILGRTMSNVLMKKGEKSRNVYRYLSKVLDSMNERVGYKEKMAPEEYIEPEDEEKSAISRTRFTQEKRLLQIELLKMQEWLKNQGSAVVIVFEGRDTAGKGSTIAKFTEYLDPKFFEVVVKGIPTEEERANWFERYSQDIEPGKITFFDRSWYNRGIVEPVMGYSSKEEYEDFMDNVNDFENDLITSGNYLIKFWLSITKDTQAKRFDYRKSSPLKYWKFSPNDAMAQEKWEEYTKYKTKVFKDTSTHLAPWTVVDSNDKRISGLNAMRYVLKQIPYEDKNEEVLSMSYPEVITTIK